MFKIILFTLVVPTGDWDVDGKIEEEEEVLGYIVTSGPCFYKLCPMAQRKKWFDAFEKDEFKCKT